MMPSVRNWNQLGKFPNWKQLERLTSWRQLRNLRSWSVRRVRTVKNGRKGKPKEGGITVDNVHSDSRPRVQREELLIIYTVPHANEPQGAGITVDNIHSDSSNSRPSGTSQTAALRRLRKDRPDLHAQVLAGDLTPHAAMVVAGFRKRTATVPAERLAHLEALAALRRAPVQAQPQPSTIRSNNATRSREV